MKAFVFSDHQCDAYGVETIFPDDIKADVAIVAGDHSPYLLSSIAALAHLAETMPVIYIPGNRDYYSFNTFSFEEINTAALHTAKLANVHLLINDSIDINGVRFIGSTLWTDFKLDGPERQKQLLTENILSDNLMIKGWSPKRQLDEHLIGRKYIETKLSEDFDGKKVVITHHAPHKKSLHPSYEESPYNGCFITDLSEILEGENAPDFWFHGAVHSNHDYKVGNTHVICNGRGYYNENVAYIRDLIIDL